MRTTLTAKQLARKAYIQSLIADDFKTLEFDGWDFSENKQCDAYISKAITLDGTELDDQDLEWLTEAISNENGLYTRLEEEFIDASVIRAELLYGDD